MSILAKSTPSQVCFLLIELVLVLLFLLFLAAAVFTKPNIGSAAGMFICARHSRPCGNRRDNGNSHIRADDKGNE